MGANIFQDILIIFLSSIFIILLLHPLRLPAIIGFIITGALIGPSGVGLIRETGQISLFAEIGVTLLLFAAGMEFSLSSLSRLKTYVIKGGFFQIALTLLAGMVVANFIGWDRYQAVYFGCMVSLSSTAIVLSTLTEKRVHESLHGRIATGILILQDLAVIPMLILLPAFGKGSPDPFPWLPLAQQMALAGLLIGAAYAFARYLANPLFKLIIRWGGQELFLITVICLALGMAWITHHMGLSFAFGSFLGGLIIGATDYKAEAFSEIKPFRICFNSLFFISIGMLLNFDFFADHLWTILFLVILIPSLKMIVTALILILLKAPARVALIVGVSLGQIGEFAFLLASMGLRAGLVDQVLYQMIIAVAAVSMLLTPLMIQWAPQIADFIAKRGWMKRWARHLLEEASPLPETLCDHAILCGYGHAGQAAGAILKRYCIPYVVLELNHEILEKFKEEAGMIFGDASSVEVLRKAKADKACLMMITSPDHLTNAAVAKQVKRLNPDIPVIARTRYAHHAGLLRASGADYIVPEDLEIGLEMGRLALRELDYPDGEIEEAVDGVREASLASIKK